MTPIATWREAAGFYSLKRCDERGYRTPPTRDANAGKQGPPRLVQIPCDVPHGANTHRLGRAACMAYLRIPREVRVLLPARVEAS